MMSRAVVVTAAIATTTSNRKMAISISSTVGPGGGLGLSFMAGAARMGRELRVNMANCVKLRPSLLLRRPGSDGPGRGPGASHPWDPKSCLCWPFLPQSRQKKRRPFRGGFDLRFRFNHLMKTEASGRPAQDPRPQDVGVGPRLGKAVRSPSEPLPCSPLAVGSQGVGLEEERCLR